MGLFPKRHTRFFLFSLLIFIYFFKYETIVRSSAWFFGHSDPDPSSVWYKIEMKANANFPSRNLHVHIFQISWKIQFQILFIYWHTALKHSTHNSVKTLFEAVWTRSSIKQHFHDSSRHSFFTVYCLLEKTNAMYIGWKKINH